MRSKILTSKVYTGGCERLLVQQEAHQAQARQKATKKKATKEQRKKEKEEKDLEVHARKEARVTKKLEKECLQVERCGRREGSLLGRKCAGVLRRSAAPHKEPLDVVVA